jgi:hypothetical protein
MQLRSFTIFSLTIAGTVLASVSGSHAAATAEEQCQKGRFDAAAKYAQCELKVIAKFFSSGLITDDGLDFQRALSKCRIKYTGTWAKLQAKASGTSSRCDQVRFAVTGGTVTDNLTGLQWERKTDDASVHDKDNYYSWTSMFDEDGTNADGTAFTTFLATLNSGSCFAGQCDWRLPTRGELQTILLEESTPCATIPCFDQEVFGPAPGGFFHVSSTTNAVFPHEVWEVNFVSGGVGSDIKGSFHYPRAVRGGL